MSIEFKLNPNFKDEVKKMLDGKLKTMEQLRCRIHNKQAWTENGKLQACCEDMARLLREAMEK